MTAALISVVDDDESVRESLPDLLREFGFEAAAFASAEAFLTSNVVDRTRCLVLDVTMPDMTGPQLQRALETRVRSIPIIFITANQDEILRRRLLEHGAVDCLFKPFGSAALFDALTRAVHGGCGPKIG